MMLRLLEVGLTLLPVILMTPLLGNYLWRVFSDQSSLLDRLCTPWEQRLFRWITVDSSQSMPTGQYLRSLLWVNAVTAVLSWGLLSLQAWLPLNPSQRSPLRWDLALHTIISFVTNTDQQHYSGELSLSNASQIGVIGFLMFTSAATGLAVGIAFVRGLAGQGLGNFYRDWTLSLTRVLIPLSFSFAVILLALGVPETLDGVAIAQTLDGSTQAIARGPIAHLEAIKLLGENGGGFLAANSAHPYENPSALSNWLEAIAMLAIPAALLDTYGRFLGNRRQAWLLLALATALLLALVSLTASSEAAGNPLLQTWLQGPNLEGKEVRFGWLQSSFWSVITTSTMTGAVNADLDSLMPLSDLALLFALFLQVIFGGQGLGAAYLIIFVLLSIFVTGLMVGRTPEFQGRKIEKPQVVLASLILLIHPLFVLIPGAIALSQPDIVQGLSQAGPHGVSQAIYEYASASANNGSGLEGIADDTLWWNLSTSVSLLGGRFIPIAALLALAAGFGQKPQLPPTAGSLRSDTPLFTGVTAIVVVILGALTFFPVLALGPIAEALQVYR
ncbi:potassium-transporting ATPase subunit KdpA [Synechococcus elongatus]|nr:potassium-transporting ATPase subunit KdpA [Synechococcus elongatus]AJD57811.1 potassium ABC transporter ATPase [Synechococcus elongatus UTEX 2973]WKW06924.1 potassium-transporting ATPase subunit KdpA [Synechococcus elongatus PCC 7942 = FACHB-805]